VQTEELWSTWIPLVTGVVSVIVGLIPVVLRWNPRHARRGDARLIGWFALLIGSSILLDTVPRAAEAPAVVRLAFAIAALVLVGVAITAYLRAKPPPRA
jgi:uncharacterized membrane protein YczE